MQSQTPISESGSNANAPLGCMVIFGRLFVVIGLAVFWSWFLIPLTTYWSAQHWEEAPCTILTAQIVETHSEDSTNYHADFTYEYQFAGRRYVGDQDHWYQGSGSHRAATARLDAFPVGKQTQCWVNPKRPEQAILDRSFSWWPVLASLLLTIPFCGFGGVIAFLGLRGLRQRSAKRAADAAPLTLALNADELDSLADGDHWSPTISRSSRLSSERASADDKPPRSSKLRAQVMDQHAAAQDLLDEQASVPRRLKPQHSRVAKLLGILFVAAFWNGIVSVFVYAFFFESPFGKGWGQIAFGLFLTPFIIIGVLLIVGCLYTLLSMFNPVISVALSAGARPPGSELDVAWEVRGGFRSLRGLKLAIVGQEWCRYVQGTDTKTDTSTFAVIEVGQVNDPDDIRFGSRTIVIPLDAMHSFDAENNKVQWSVQVQGEIPWWPDIFEVFHFRVTPPLTTVTDHPG